MRVYGIPDILAVSAVVLILSFLFGSAPLSAQTNRQPGRWAEVRQGADGPELNDEQRRELDRLRTLGYVGGSRDTRDSGITVHERVSVAEGYNLYSSGHGPEAILMDMDGNVLHTWHHPFRDIWPDNRRADGVPGTEWWRRVHLYENGDLLAIFEGFGLIKINAQSELIWASPIAAHHDLEVMPDGDIYVLTREAGLKPRINARAPVSEDFVSILDENGIEKKRFSVLEALEESAFAGVWHLSPRKSGDLFHTNSLEVLEGRIADRSPAFKKGNLLVSSRVLNAVAVIDPEMEVVVWLHQGAYRSQHDPKILANGNLLLFDNSGLGYDSSVLEYDTANMTVVWSYSGSRRHPMYSRFCGAAQRLADGHTLITESDNGRALEVTSAGQTVWEFYNPHRAGRDGGYIACIGEMIRLPADFPLSWVQGLGED